MSEAVDVLESALADPQRRAVLELVACELDRLFELHDEYMNEHDGYQKNRLWNAFGAYARATMKRAMRKAEEACARLRHVH